MDVLTVHSNTDDSYIVSDVEDDVLIDFQEIELDWNDTMALRAPRFTSKNQLRNDSVLMNFDAQDCFFDTSAAAADRTQIIISDSPNEFGEETKTTLSLEPTPINPSGSINVVKRIDEALEESFRSSSLPASLYETMAHIFAVAKPMHDKENGTVSSKVAVSSALLKPSFSLLRETSVISFSSTSTSEGRSMSDRWNDRYQDLKAFVKKHGHCHVPINYKDNPLLSRWIKRQRYQWKLKEEGKQSSLTDARFIKLEELGFLWDVRSIIWDTRYRELLQFHKRHGHCNVGINCKEFPKLVSELKPTSLIESEHSHILMIHVVLFNLQGTWVKCQRRQYCLMVSGQKSHMTPSRIQLLQKVGFSWNGKQADTK
ncbi:helicase domain protein [Nitzschia inconspicua]|uniref:Helicase domain protein n=1 Tax=Nitzschia inconspicua TaxID=303405 RepID=A0A9K3LL32_9STRA|nr:helicase domain protein [Nitzschia inconspicua]